MNENQYKEFVKLGKAQLSIIVNHQKKICSYAMEVVTIRHGGRSGNLYTIKRYAEDIGMNPKTLQNWLQVYNNVIMKLDEPEKADFKTASKVNNVLEEHRVLDNAAANKSGTRMAYKKDVPAEKVKSIYYKYTHEKPFEGEFVNIMQEIKSHRNLIEKRDLNIIKDEHLQVYLDTLNMISSFVSQHLIKKRRNMGRTA